MKERKNPCGNDKEIDEYLDGTICEVVIGEEELNDIEAPSGENYEVNHESDPEKIEDEYIGKVE